MTTKKSGPGKKAAKPSDKKKPAKAKASASKEPPKAETSASADDRLWQDYSDMAGMVSDMAEKGQDVFSAFLKSQPGDMLRRAERPVDPLNVGGTMQSALSAVFSDPANVMRMQIGMWQDYAHLTRNMVQKMMGQTSDPVAEPDGSDRRFAHPAWTENNTLDYIKQSYLIMSRWAREMVASAENLDDHTRQKALFYTEQYLAAISPTNFPSTNPQVMEETLRTNGENFIKGFKNFLEDMERGDGELAMRQADLDYFKVGENIAASPGKVVYQNDLIQLIQYAPATEKVARRPLLIIPPFINKFYILDLQPSNSLISWLVEQGRTVFVVSWVNPGPELASKTFEDYMQGGIYDALTAVEDATGEPDADAIGYCIGGTLLACVLAQMAEKNDDRIKTATFFTAQTDFTEAGELLLFVDEEQLNNIEKQVDVSGGILKGSAMAQTFNMLRPVDLIWSVYVDNYLLGKDPKRFDLLYWNSDSTAMSKAVYLYYLRQFYQHNKLSKGELEIGGKPLNLGNVKIPVFMQSGEKDHIAPYRSIYRSAKMFGGETTFMLAGSGHIAGVINHPDNKKYHYSTNENLPDTVEKWQEDAIRHDHSWWPYWIKWLNKRSPGKVATRQPGDGKLKAVEDAPGSYVKKRA